MLHKLAATIMVVAVAGSCALAQGQSNPYQATKTSTEAVTKQEPAKVQDAERDIYRTVKTSTAATQKVKTVKDVKRPVSGANEVSKATRTYPKATRVDVEAAKKNPAPEAKKRVNNTVNALPPNYKKASELKTKPTENK